MPTRTIRREPIKLFRVWCGRKRYSGWHRDIDQVWRIAIEHGIAYGGLNGGRAGLGPLTWIERGERRYGRSRTRTIGRHA